MVQLSEVCQLQEWKEAMHKNIFRANIAAAAIAATSALCGPPEASDVSRESHSSKTLLVDAQKNCVFMSEAEPPASKAARMRLKPGRTYRVSVSGEAWMSQHTGSSADPFPGVTVFYCSDEQDGFATEMRVLKPGDEIVFDTPKRKSKDLFLAAFFVDYWTESENGGSMNSSFNRRRIKTADGPTSRGNCSI